MPSVDKVMHRTEFYALQVWLAVAVWLKKDSQLWLADTTWKNYSHIWLADITETRVEYRVSTASKTVCISFLPSVSASEPYTQEAFLQKEGNHALVPNLVQQHSSRFTQIMV